MSNESSGSPMTGSELGVGQWLPSNFLSFSLFILILSFLIEKSTFAFIIVSARRRKNLLVHKDLKKFLYSL